MADNSQSRKWTLVFNNPLEYGMNHDAIKEKLHRFAPKYYCLADEVGANGTFHTHLFFVCDSPVRFSTIKSRYPIAHIEKAFGSAQENRAYITKSGRWEEDVKAETIVEGSFEEYGEVPSEQAENNPLTYQLIQDLKDGKHTAKIVESSPSLVFKVKEIETLRQTLLAEYYSTEYRSLEVTYLYGATGTGKTRSIFQKHPGHSICRITSYRRDKGVLFDAYTSQDILVLEEFDSQIPITEMLNYLDVYPLHLPARYQDRIACYTKVYITSNKSLLQQYPDVQRQSPETWKAFLRRIHHVLEFREDGTIAEINLRKEINNE